MLSVKGYAGTRLSDVAEYTEIQAPAIYYYFPSREDLIREVMCAGIADMSRHLQEVLDALPPETSPMAKGKWYVSELQKRMIDRCTRHSNLRNHWMLH